MAALLKKIPAATLVETLVAVSILSLVAGFAITIFLMVSSPRSSVQPLLHAQQRSAEMLDTLTGFTLGNPQRHHFETEAQNLSFIRDCNEEGRLTEAEVKVADPAGKTVYTRKRLFYAYEKWGDD